MKPLKKVALTRTVNNKNVQVKSSSSATTAKYAPPKGSSAPKRGVRHNKK